MLGFGNFTDMQYTIILHQLGGEWDRSQTMVPFFLFSIIEYNMQVFLVLSIYCCLASLTAFLIALILMFLWNL